MNPIRETLRSRSAGGGAALLPYMMAGLPSPERCVDCFVAMAEAGADGFEIGFPYADPLMDGPVIQEAGKRALEAGIDLDAGFRTAARIVESTGLPCVVMTYVNPVLRLGAQEFTKRAADAGVSGLIIADLPVDEAAPLAEAANQAGIGLVLFAAPTISDERLRRVVEADPLFVYGVAELGVTGERTESGGRAAALAERIRGAGDVPVVLGVGISEPAQAAEAAQVADGVIVGSALVRRALGDEDPVASVASAVGDLASAVHQS